MTCHVPTVGTTLLHISKTFAIHIASIFYFTYILPEMKVVTYFLLALLFGSPLVDSESEIFKKLFKYFKHHPTTGTVADRDSYLTRSLSLNERNSIIVYLLCALSDKPSFCAYVYCICASLFVV